MKRDHSKQKLIYELFGVNQPMSPEGSMNMQQFQLNFSPTKTENVTQGINSADVNNTGVNSETQIDQPQVEDC